MVNITQFWIRGFTVKDLIGFIILIFCFLLVMWAFKDNDLGVGLIAYGLFLIGSKVFKY